MRDLVETVIAEVMRRDPPLRHGAQQTTPPRSNQGFARTLDVARGRWSATTLASAASSARKPSPAPGSDRSGPATSGERHANRRLWKASRAFEAMMVQQMLGAMRKTVPQSKLLHAGFAEDVQGAMFDQAVAREAAREGGLGIAEAIYRQMSRAQDIAHDADNDSKAVPVLRARRGG